MNNQQFVLLLFVSAIAGTIIANLLTVLIEWIINRRRKNY